MACTVWCSGIPGFLLLLAMCPEGSTAYLGDRFFPSTLATTVPTAAEFLVRLPDTANNPTTHEIDNPATYRRLVSRDLGALFAVTFRTLATDQIRTGREGSI